MSEQIIYHEELQKAVAAKLQDFDVYWEPQEAPRDICLGNLTAYKENEHGDKFTMKYEIQRDYYAIKSEVATEIEAYADDFIDLLSSTMP